MIIPMLAIAGNLAQKKYVPPSLGTFPVTTPLFTGLLIGVILIVGALTFFPALSLGPILEHLLMAAGKSILRGSAMARKSSKKAIWEVKIVRRAIVDSLLKLDPRHMMGNPVMFVVEVGSVITTALLFRGGADFKFNLQITLWLWFTVLLPTSPKRWQKAAGRRRQTRFSKARSETVANRALANGSD